MEIKVLPLGMIGANCYLISTEKAAVAVDIGFYSPLVDEFFENSNRKEKLILLTHAHFDHIGGAKVISQKHNAKIAIGAGDADALLDGDINLSNRFHAKIEPFNADILLKDGDTLKCGDLEFKTIHTPGHTIGGVCYLLGDVLFSGDTLFYENIGRTDFPGGDFKTLENSIKKLYDLNENITVLSGHGGESTIGHEKQFNPYVRGV